MAHALERGTQPRQLAKVDRNKRYSIDEAVRRS